MTAWLFGWPVGEVIRQSGSCSKTQVLLGGICGMANRSQFKEHILFVIVKIVSFLGLFLAHKTFIEFHYFIRSQL